MNIKECNFCETVLRIYKCRKKLCDLKEIFCRKCHLKWEKLVNDDWELREIFSENFKKKESK